MPQAIGETVFDVLYLGFALSAGLTMLIKGTNPLVKKAGLMATLLGAGDSFHLVTRSYALWTNGLEANAAALGIGKLITSITMTIFYLILYYIWRERYEIEGQENLTKIMWGLSVLRIAFCLLPQNQWLVYHQPLFFGILRNIPFAVMFCLRRKQKKPMTRFSDLCHWLLGFPLDSICLSSYLAGSHQL